MDEIEVPLHFLCPISLQLMRDPVIISTGITYDRESIKKWLFSCKNSTCPVTKQSLSDTDLTPNHTLCRLIQSWCTLNASNGIERIPTPKPAIEKALIIKLLKDAKNSSDMELKCLQRLRSIAHQRERNNNCWEAAGAIEFLASIIKKNEVNSDIVKEALSILCSLETSEIGLKNLVSNDAEFVGSLLKILKYGNQQSRVWAITILKSIFKAADPIQLISVKPEFFIEIVKVLRDQISPLSSKAALKLLSELCPWGRNRIKAVEGGAVAVLIEILLETSERRFCELSLVVLDQICGSAVGRAELLKHGAGLAIVSKKILRVSHVASYRAVRILGSVSKFSATSRVLQEMLEVGVVTKLCLVLQLNSGLKTREKTREILKLHAGVWRNSPCIPAHLLYSYPSSPIRV